jgi:hypothetical protein
MNSTNAHPTSTAGGVAPRLYLLLIGISAAVFALAIALTSHLAGLPATGSNIGAGMAGMATAGALAALLLSIVGYVWRDHGGVAAPLLALLALLGAGAFLILPLLGLVFE